MKIKNLVCVLALWLICCSVNAQVSTKYTYTNSAAATYSLINSGQTTLCTGTGAGTSNSFYQGGAVNTAGSGIPIGFTFVYNCVSYTSLGVHTNSFVWFGSGTPATTTTEVISNASANLGGSGMIDGAIAAWAGSIASTPRQPGNAASAIRYRLDGVAGSRIFKIEWCGYRMTGSTTTNATIPSTSIWLYETSNKIEVYTNSQSSILVSGTRTGQIGLRGTSNSDFKNTNGAGTMWSGIPAGTLNTHVTTTSASSYPNGGRVFVWNFTGSCCTPPTTPASGMNFSALTTSSVQVNWTNGNGTERVVVAHQATAVSANPANGTDYTAIANANFASGPNLGSNNYVVFAGTGNSVNVTGLTPGQTYFFSVFEYLTSPSICYLTPGHSGSQLIPVCFPPTVAASGINFSNVLTTSNDVNWTRGDGDAGVIVVARLSTSINSAPVTGTGYTANAAFGSGSQIGTGNYVVYQGAGTTVSVTNLLPSTNYVYSVYEYNAAGICYGSPGSGNQTTASCSPSAQPTSLTVPCVDYTTMTLSFNRGNGTHTIVLAKATSAVNADPAYNASYTASTVFGSGSQIGTGNYVVYNGNDPGTVSVSVTNLTPGVTYHFKAYEYNDSPNCYNYVTPPIISKATRNAGTYTSSTTTQNTATVVQGSLAQDVVKLTIVVGGGVDQAAVLNSITFSTTGSTNAANDITNAKIFYTGGTNTFSNATQFGSTFTSFAGSLIANGNFALLAGNNYFWIAYDVKMAATVGNVLDATITSINITDNNGTGNQTPSVTAPAGSRTITPAVLPYCAGQPGTSSSRASCGFGENITSVNFGSGNIVAGYSCNSTIGYDNLTATNSVTLNPGLNYTATIVADIWFSIEYTWVMWFDWNQDGDFADAGERYPATGNILNYGTASQAIAVPVGAIPGATRMRLWHQEYSHPAPATTPCRTSNGILTTSIGQVMDITVNIPGIPPTGNEPVSCATDAPIVTTPVNYAFNATAGQLTATGTTLLWYTGASGGTGSSTAPTPLTNVSGTTAYYVSQTNTSGSPICEGPRTQIAVVVAPQPCGVAPSITTCASSVPQDNDAGLCSAVVNYTAATASGDPSPVITYSQNSGTVFNVGTTTVTVTATNANGTTTCTFPVTVNDTEAPVANVTTLPDITAECSASATAPTATDNCAGTVTATTVDPTSYSTQGSFIVHWSYDDGNGNIVTQNQNVIVDDVTNPTINNCPGDISSCNPVVSWTAPTASDNCGTASLNSNYNPGATFPTGATTVTYTADDGNGNTATCNFTVTVVENPTAVISQNSAVCLGQPASIHLVFTGTGPWNYTVSDGSQTVSGSAATSPVDINITPSSTGVHNYAVTVLSDVNCSGTGSGTATVTVSSAPPTNSVGTLTAPLQACSGDVSLITSNGVGGQNVNYSWNTGTNSSVVKFSTNAGGPFVSGPFLTTVNSVYAQFGAVITSGYDICVQGVNGCGSTNNKCTWVRGKVSPPATITGPNVACPGNIKNYSCSLSGGASLYNWSFNVPGAVITNNGTANVQVTFPSFTSGQLCVTAALACGGSSTSAPKCITVSNIPASPGTVTGPAKVCPGATGISFSITPISGASGYNWTVPAGATITGGANTSSITVSFPNPYTGAPPVCVSALSTCASSVSNCKAVGSNLPGQPGAMTGPTNGVCNSTVQYSIANVNLATSYTWTIPAGSTNFLGQGSTAIQFTVPPAPFTSGIVSVVANTTACSPGTSTPRTITIYGAPSTPGTIAANPSAWCDFGFINFSITPASPLPVYQWVVTNGSIDAGQNSNNIDVTWGTGAGIVKVRAANSCGASSYRTLNTSSVCREEKALITSGALSVYPNPAHDKLTVELNNSINEQALIRINDLTGKLIYSQQAEFLNGMSAYEIDLTHIAKGVYILSVERSSGAERLRIAVQ